MSVREKVDLSFEIEAACVERGCMEAQAELIDERLTAAEENLASAQKALLEAQTAFYQAWELKKAHKTYESILGSQL